MELQCVLTGIITRQAQRYKTVGWLIPGVTFVIDRLATITDMLSFDLQQVVIT